MASAALLASKLFPDEPTTQEFARQAIQVIQQADLDIAINTENIGSLIQAFSRGDDAA